MARIINYDTVSSLDSSYSFVVDSSANGTRRVPATKMLNKLFKVSDVEYPDEVGVLRDLTDLDLPAAQSGKTRSAALAAPMSVYYISSSDVASTFNDLPSNVAGILVTYGKYDEAVDKRRFQIFSQNAASLRPVWYRTCRSSSENVGSTGGWSKWGVLSPGGGMPSQLYPLDPESGVTLVSGGFYAMNNRVYVDAVLKHNTKDRYATLSLAQHLPQPYQAGAKLNIFRFNYNSGVAQKGYCGEAYVLNSGTLQYDKKPIIEVQVDEVKKDGKTETKISWRIEDEEKPAATDGLRVTGDYLATEEAIDAAINYFNSL